MDFRKALLVKSFRELFIITTCLSHNNLRKSQISKKRRSGSVNLPYIEGTSEKLRHIHRSHELRSTFYTENTLRNLFCKDRVATEDKNNIAYQIGLGESKQSLKSHSDEHKISVRNSDCDKNETAKHSWEAHHNFSRDQKKVVDREIKLIPMNIKETIHSLKNLNHINKVSYMFSEIWFPNLW